MTWVLGKHILLMFSSKKGIFQRNNILLKSQGTLEAVADLNPIISEPWLKNCVGKEENYRRLPKNLNGEEECSWLRNELN